MQNRKSFVNLNRIRVLFAIRRRDEKYAPGQCAPRNKTASLRNLAVGSRILYILAANPAQAADFMLTTRRRTKYAACCGSGLEGTDGIQY